MIERKPNPWARHSAMHAVLEFIKIKDVQYLQLVIDGLHKLREMLVKFKY